MDLFDSKKKKKLDFSRPTFDEREFKVPCRDVTNSNVHANNTQSEASSEKTLFADDEFESSRDSDASSLVSASRETVSVYLRLKPTEEQIPEVYCFEDEKVILEGKSQRGKANKYTFTSVLSQSTDQQTLYSTCIRPVLASPFSSSGAVFASYGVSNSGKTYTIIGDKGSAAGVVPRALAQVFSEYNQQIAEFPCVKIINDQISILEDDQVSAEMEATWNFLTESQKSVKGKMKTTWIADVVNDHQFEPVESSGDFQKVYIWISFVEIYNDTMIDLLKAPAAKGSQATAQRSLKIIANNGHPYVQGLTSLYVSNLESAIELLQFGLRHVNYAATAVNNHSSRSHTVFTISMIKECDSTFMYSSFKFCDLAGAERTKKTGNVGERLKEAGGINTCLSVLGKCLEAVQHNQKPGVKREIVKKKIVPVRESKLTFLLQSSLMGQEKFVMIVNLLPTLDCFDENINVLHFGSIANEIVTRRLEPRKMSARYSFFMKCAINSPKMMLSFHEDNESSLEPSFEESLLTKEDLLQMLHKKEVESEFLRETIRVKEREFLDRERELKEQNHAIVEARANNEKIFFEQKVQINKRYMEKKIDSVRQMYERKLKGWEEENDLLLRENRKLKAKLGITDDEDIIDVDESEDEDIDDNEEEMVE